MDKLKQIPARFLEIWKSWSRNQKIIIVSAVAVFIAAVVVIAFVLSRPTYQELTSLEMNEYAESVLGEINRNHNEAVFLYDMLNEKSKEVKTTVKDVNYAKKQVEQISGRTSDMSDNAVMSEEHEQDRTDDGKEPAYEQAVKSGKDTKDIAKERLAALVKKSNQKAKNAEDRINTQADSLNKEYSNNERILQMNASGVSVKEIAKKLNMGVGEVRLVINLYKGGKQQ